MKPAAALACVAGMAACSKSSGSTPPVDTCTGATVTVAANQVATVPASSAWCVSLPADGATYLVSPNLASDNGPSTTVGVEIGSGPPAAMDVLPEVAGRFAPPMPSIIAPPRGLHEQFDHLLREKERTFTPAMRGARKPQAEISAAAPPVLGDRGIFRVLSSLQGGYKTDTAFVKFAGARIIIYESQNAPVGGFSAADYTALGNTFDTDLYPIDVNAFGAPADVDANARVFVLLTPKVNALTPANQCATLGYIAGYFDGTDEIPSLANSNGAEIFYGIVPDPFGTASCVHEAAVTGQRTLATFIHEFQHMISFNQHYLLRGGSQEDTWLNEGMSHIAEELGSRYYEAKYPPPSGRTDPSQLFPDSSQGFIGGDLGNFYRYLQGTGPVSVTLFASSGSLEERGASWLFLRWLADLKGEAILATLVQTGLTGTANIESQAGESFPALFGDFSLALYADSLPGFPRATAPVRDRFQTRNLRALSNRLFVTSPSNFPLPFPILTRTLPLAGKTTTSMMVGTMLHYKITMPASGSEMRLHFTATGGGSLPAGYNGQVTVYHCPSAAACQ